MTFILSISVAVSAKSLELLVNFFLVNYELLHTGFKS